MIGNRSFWLKSLSVVSAAGLLVFGFQNCGKAGFDQALDQISTGTVDATSAAAPFAFDASFDQITYNSCSGSNLSASKGFFTLMAGAYDSAGVSVRPGFLTYVNSKLQPIYPATTVSVEQIKQFVVGTTENAEAQLQMALRFQGSPQKLLVPSGNSNPIEGTDFVTMLMDLTDDRMMEPVFRNPGLPFNYFPLAPLSTQRNIEGQFSRNQSEAEAMSFRNSLDNVLLSLTYTAYKNAGGMARAPSNVAANSNIVYGRGYLLRFAQEVAPYPTGGAITPNSRNPANILAQVTEVNYENPAVATGAGWTCDMGMRFTIMSRADAGLCPPDAFESMNDANYRRQLQIVRRHLRADQWDVSINNRCVVPKNGTCYAGNSGAEEPVEYDQRNECYQNVDGFTNPQITKRCAQYVSICVRQ